MDNCFICSEPSVGQLEFDSPKGKHFIYPFCKSHQHAVAEIYVGLHDAAYQEGYKDGYAKCLQEAKRILRRETKGEKQLQKEIESLRWDLDELIDKLNTKQD
jgi:hypothetical protein